MRTPLKPRGVPSSGSDRLTATSARFTAGHFFKAVTFTLLAFLTASCSSEDQNLEPQHVTTGIIPDSEETTILVRFPQGDMTDGMPESVTVLEHTAGGRFYPLSSTGDMVFMSLAEQADQSGLLILAVLPEGFEFTGTRDHLLVWLDADGAPSRVEPEMTSDLLADSLWTDPLTRQQTIVDLASFSRPDIVLQWLPEQGVASQVVNFWGSEGVAQGFTAALYTSPTEQQSSRGWGVFTGIRVCGDVIQGMTLEDFHATVLMSAGLDWYDKGYPAMEAFTQVENR